MTSLNETKMAILATMIWMFAYFAILWLRMRRNRRSRRSRALLEASRRRLAALYVEQEEMHAVLSVRCTRRFFLSTLQQRSSWMMPRCTDFSANTIQSCSCFWLLFWLQVSIRSFVSAAVQNFPFSAILFTPEIRLCAYEPVRDTVAYQVFKPVLEPD